MMSLEQVNLIKQIYPKFNTPLYESIRINATTRIMEMLPKYRKRILTHKNKMIENRIFITNARRNTATRFKPMRYTQILCHACYKEICERDLYLSKNGEHGRSKFYHVNCAVLKNVL